MSTETQDENKRHVEKLFDDCFSRGELSLLEELVSPDYVNAQGERGPAGFRGITVGLRTAFPDIHYTLDDLVAESDKVAVRWHWSGTHRGQFRTFPPTGKAVTNAGSGIFRFKDGKIVAAAIDTDRLGFLQQIGVIPEGVGGGPPRPAATATPTQ